MDFVDHLVVSSRPNYFELRFWSKHHRHRNQKDTWVQRLGYACTDANGYFVLLVEDATKTDTGALSIDVVRSGKVIYVDPNPVEIQPGHVVYREIIIGRTTEPCPPPGGKGEMPTPPAAPPSSGGSEPPRPATKKGSAKTKKGSAT